MKTEVRSRSRTNRLTALVMQNNLIHSSYTYPYLTQLCSFCTLSPLLHFTKLLAHLRRATPTPPKPRHWPKEHFSEGPSRFELEIKDTETDKKCQKRGWDANSPKEPFPLLHGTNISGIHAQDTGDECQGKENDSDGGENVKSFGVVFSVDFNRLLSLSQRTVSLNNS
jgi:hypothetical protein